MSAVAALGSALLADPFNGRDSTQNSLWCEGSITLSGNYGGGSTNGDTLDLTPLQVSSDYAPKYVTVYQESTAGNAPVIYCFLYARGTTQANGLLQVTDFAGAQITQGAAYPAALTSTATPPNIRFRAEFAKNI